MSTTMKQRDLFKGKAGNAPRSLEHAGESGLVACAGDGCPHNTSRAFAALSGGLCTVCAKSPETARLLRELYGP